MGDGDPDDGSGRRDPGPTARFDRALARRVEDYRAARGLDESTAVQRLVRAGLDAEETAGAAERAPDDSGAGRLARAAVGAATGVGLVVAAWVAVEVSFQLGVLLPISALLGALVGNDLLGRVG
jgi:hypothetical protein